MRLGRSEQKKLQKAPSYDIILMKLTILMDLSNEIMEFLIFFSPDEMKIIREKSKKSKNI